MQETNYLSKRIKIFAGIAAFIAFFIIFNDDYLEHLVLLIIAFAFFKIDYIIQRYKIVDEHPGILGMIIAPLFLSFFFVSIPALLWWLDIINRSIFSLNTDFSSSFTYFISHSFERLVRIVTFLLYSSAMPSLGIIFARMYYVGIALISLIILAGITISGFAGYRIGLKRRPHFLTYPFIFLIILVILLDIITRLIW